MVDSRRERLRKEKANHDVNIQSTVKYNQKCIYKGTRHLSKQEVDVIISLPISMQDDYLRSIGKFEMEGC